MAYGHLLREKGGQLADRGESCRPGEGGVSLMDRSFTWWLLWLLVGGGSGTAIAVSLILAGLAARWSWLADACFATVTWPVIAPCRLVGLYLGENPLVWFGWSLVAWAAIGAVLGAGYYLGLGLFRER